MIKCLGFEEKKRHMQFCYPTILAFQNTFWHQHQWHLSVVFPFFQQSVLVGV